MVVTTGFAPSGPGRGRTASAIGTRETLLIAAAGGCLAALWLVRSPLAVEVPRPAEAAGRRAEPAGPARPAGRGEPAGDTGGLKAPQAAPRREVCLVRTLVPSMATFVRPSHR